MSSIRILALLSILFVIAGCGGKQGLIAVIDDGRQAYALEDVLVATSRAPDATPGIMFGSQRAQSLSFADIAVSVPPDRKPGSVPLPTLAPDPKRQFAVASADTGLDEARFVAALDRRLEALPPEHRTVLIFVHGYNTSFAEGVYRLAQIRHDFKFGGPVVHYSWPSGGKPPLYVYDRDSVAFARDGLYRTLKIVARSKARGIFLVGHSMGTLLTMESLRQAGLAGDSALLDRIETVVLASPDIDTDVFRTQVAAVKPLPQPFVILVSSRDRALQASRFVGGGHPRVGSGVNTDELTAMGIAVFDLSNVKDGDGINHSTFAASPTVARLAASGALKQALYGERGDEALDFGNDIGDGIGAVSDLAAQIIYLPAKVVGVR